MNGFKINHLFLRTFFLTISIVTSSLGYTAHIGGSFNNDGFHGPDNNWNDSGHVHDDDYNNVGNYHPGNGWTAPVIIQTNNGGDDSENCQTMQQCDSFGNCTSIQQCN